MTHPKPSLKLRVVLLAALLFFGGAFWRVTVKADGERNCDAATALIPADPTQALAITDAKNYAAKSWMETGPDWHSVSETAAMARNPFDVKGAAPAAIAVRSQVWARHVICLIKPLAAGPGFAVVFRAGAVRFFDGRGPWSKPNNGGILVALELTRRGATADIKDVSDDFSILMPDSIYRRPTAAELPKPGLWSIR